MNNNTVIRGENDLATIRPDLVKYFVDASVPFTIRPYSTTHINSVSDNFNYGIFSYHDL